MLNLGLLFFMSLYSLAWSAPEIHAKLQWNCPQDQYPGIVQIPSSAAIKIWFSSVQGRTKGNIEPNIFNPKVPRNPPTIAVDYVNCLLDFSDTIVEAIKAAQALHCTGGAANELCQGDANQLKSYIDTLTWGSTYITKRAPWPKLPTSLPGNASVPVNENVIKPALDTFCESGRHEPKILFSAPSLRFAAAKASTSCKRRFSNALASYGEKIKKVACPVSKPLCDYIQGVVSKSIASVSPGFSGIALTEEEEGWMKQLLPISQEESLLSDMERLQKMLTVQDLSPSWCTEQFNAFMGRALGYSPELVVDLLKKAVGRFDETCIKEVIRSLTFHWPLAPRFSLAENAGFKDFCDKNRNSFVCTVPESRQKIRHSLLRILADELGEQDKDQIHSMLLKEMNKSYADNKDRWKSIMGQLSCRELLPGQKRLIGRLDSMTTGVSAQYQLHLKNNGNYEVKLGMHFKNSEDGVTPDMMFNRVRTCIKGVTGYMKSADGKPLSIEILTKAEAQAMPLRQRPPVVELTIQKLVENGRKKSRSHSTSYESNIDCSAITHEVLHLLGLYDEYDESDICYIKKGKINKKVPWGTPGAKCASMTGSNYNCRSVAAVNSIMAEHWETFDTVVPNSISCDCKPRRPNQASWEGYCHKIMSGPDGTLKNLYLMASLNEILPFRIRSKYCGEMKYDKSIRGAFRGDKSLYVDEERSSPTRLTILTQELEYSVQTAFHNEITCECEDDDEACISEIEKVREKVINVASIRTRNCPVGTGVKTKYLNTIENPDIVARVNAEARGYIFEKETLYLANYTTATNLLHPSHYERITGGACGEKAKDYSLCSEWAYKQNLSCEARPAVCGDGLKFLGIK